jgi:DNA polymerase elongation subunit (family B)
MAYLVFSATRRKLYRVADLAAQTNPKNICMTKKELAIHYREKHGLEMPTKSLARKMAAEHPEIFPDIENARTALRTIEGKMGKDKIKERIFEKPNRPWAYQQQIDTPAKILILDIETAPILAYVWGIWNQNVATSQIASDWFCLTWAAKWLFQDKVYSAKLTKREVLEKDDSRIIRGIWEMVNEADIVIAHNAEKFDMPKLNSRFIANGLQPPLPYITIDTLKHIRRHFGFVSNKLDYVNQILNLPRKQENSGMALWIKCYNGDTEALKEMETYNVQDVRILEETYLAIRPWIKPHPNIGLHILDGKTSHCPTCGSDNLQDQGKFYHTSVNRYELYRCGNCGASARKRVAKDHINLRRHLITGAGK